MKLFILKFCTLFLAFSHTHLQAQTLEAPPEINKETIEDFIYLLNTSTGQKWNVGTSNTGPRITLQIQNNSHFKSKEAFKVQSNGKDRLSITSSSVEGLVFGFYKHLRNLGFKFYLPDEQYVIIPKLKHPFGAPQDKVDQPFLQVRNFFGTGGFGSLNPDPGKIVEKDWNRWKLRNGLGSAYHLSGHHGEDFILANYELLKTKPGWLASPITGNKHQDLGIKLNYLNKEALDYYVDWSLKPLLAKGYKPPPPNHIEHISMEPSDGGGYLNELPAYSKKQLPSISDQVYSAANLAAEKLEKLFPGYPNLRVNIYAYSSHAEPPSFPLHKRVFVQLIPYSFQNIAFGPSFIKIWKSKVKNFALYDYFRYTDSQFDLPGGITLDDMMKRLIHSVKNGSEGTVFESSYSKFSTGIPLYIAARYMADGQIDYENQLAQVSKDLYGTASGNIDKLFNLFYRSSEFDQHFLGNAAELVDRAFQSASNGIEKQRINELKIYLHFAKLVYNSRDAKAGNLEQRLLPLAEYSWRIYPTKIIHAYRIMQLASYAFLNADKTDKNYARYQKLHVDWFPDTERSRTAFNSIPQEIPPVNRDFSNILKEYKTVKILNKFSIKDVLNQAALQGLKPKSNIIFAGDALTRGYLGIYTDKPSTVTINYSLAGPTPIVRISSVDAGFSKDTIVIVSKNNGSIIIPVGAGETTLFFNAADGAQYRMEAKINNGLFYFDGSPRGKMAFYKSLISPFNQYTYDPQFYPSHIYIPVKAEKLNYKVQLNMLQLISPENRKIQSVLKSNEHAGFEYRELDLKQSETGKIWRAEIAGNFNYSLLNIPDRYFLLTKKNQ